MKNIQKKGLHRVLSFALSLALTISMVPSVYAAEMIDPPPASNGEVTLDTVWKYLDDNTDPAGDSSAANYDRTSWTAPDYDDSTWKSAAGTFGSKRGSANYDSTHIADNILTGCDAANDTPAYFFRTSFEVTSLDDYNKLVGSVIYDDGVIVYINGQRIAAGADKACDESGNALGHGFDANLQYGGSNQGPDLLEISVTDLSVVHPGTNTVAVEIHNGRKTSSDVWFSMPELKLTYEEPQPAEQSSISLSMGADESQMNFTWYCNEEGNGSILLAEKSDLVKGNMPEDAAEFSALATAANKSGYFSNQATVTGLKAGTTYAYQLVNGTTKSKIMTFTTTTEGAFSFAFAGDPQIGAGNIVTDTEGWSKTLDRIVDSKKFDGVDFLLSAGDQVNTASDENQYNGYLEHEALQGLPVATVIGNHDSDSSSYGQHFNVPNETAYGATSAGNDYYYVYNNVLFMIINSNNRSTAGHKSFMESAIKATEDMDIAWKVVSFHHSIYTVASHAEDSDILARRQELAPVFKELDVDVVLMGHDHVYCRTYMMDGLTPMTDASIYDDEDYSSITNPEGILYVTANSASGSKFYTLKNAAYDYSAVLNQERVPNISRIDVSENDFTITTYRTSDMSTVDSFTIHKTHVHSEEIIPAVAPSCTATGLTEGKKCSVCGEILVAQETIEALGHNYFGDKCTVCGYTKPYAITVADSVHGKVAVSSESAHAGETVKIDVTPDKGYILKTITVTDKNGKEVELTANEVGAAYSFTMPEGSAVIDATFAEDNTMLNYFVDVPADAYYYDAVLWAAKNGITDGVDANHFAPNTGCTRAQAVTFLWRAAGCSEPKSACGFADVNADAYYAKAIAWAAEQGITLGTSATTFSPDSTCTRAQIMTFLYRFNGQDTMEIKDNPFSDVAVGQYYSDAVLWGAKNGITNGATATTFGPDSTCTRAQIVTFMYRYMV